MGLGKYFAKRRFSKTPEPKGTIKKSGGKKLAFVIQEHHASTLHYDFRLEMDGVLKSWAVPKGPSMDPHQHHLAVQTEDHPYEYRTFEGIIPEGNYGAGNVIIWDEGWYEPRAETNNPEKTLLDELAKGHVTFVLHGKKLHGEFALIQMHKQGDSAWLLVKKGDSFASEADITQQNESVKTGRTVDQLGAHNKLPNLSAFPKKAAPLSNVQPMLCTLIEEPFDRSDWLFEIKWDGFRAIGTKHKNQVSLRSRNNIDFMEKFPPVAEALHNLDHDVILDGEIVVVDADGSPHFEWLQDWKRTGNGELRYQAFDILWCDGRDVRTMPLRDRKALLKSIIPAQSVIKYSDHVEEKGLALFQQMERHGLEGIVAKQATSTYQENVRGADWLKIKTHRRQEVVIGGFTEPRGSRTYLGSLIVGVYNNGVFEYVGHSGGGIPDAQRKQLRTQLDKLERKTSPFSTDIPKSDTAVHWVKPELVCEMNFAEWTSGGQMRQPKFVGMREDKNPMNVKREKPAGKTKPTAKPEFSHLDKVFFPKHKYTKGNLIDYYQSVADYMLPYLADRPHSLLRQPGGVTDHGFFQKNMEHLPEWAPTADIYSESNKANIHWLVGGKLQTLEYMVQLGCIEINPWNSRVQHLENPDWAVMDLDPEGVTFNDVITVARTVHNICDELQITAIPKTSGKTGIHIYMPLGAKYTHGQAKDFVHLLAIEVNKRQPKLTSLERMPAKRPHKIYLDYLQNREGQTLAAPYSVRPTPDATVATPLHWDEVKKGLLPTDYTITNIHRRLARVGDLWKPVLGPGNDLAKILARLEKSHKDSSGKDAGSSS